MRTFPVIALVAGLTLAGCGGMGKIDYWQVLTSGRDGWQHPERVVDALALSPGDVAADLGAGDGYFVTWLSRAVGPAGKVYAVEVDDEKVGELEAWADRESLSNVEVVRGDYADPRLPDGEIDLVFTCNTYHHIEQRPDYFRRLRTDLAPNGRVAHLDERDDVHGILRIFQSRGHWMNVAEMRSEMQQAGYHHVESFDFLPTQSFEVFAAGAP